MRSKLIHIALAPNLSWEIVLASLSWIIFPWKWLAWKRGRYTDQLEHQFAGHCKAVGSGRQALFESLGCLKLKSGDEVIVQSFTCMVVINAIKWNGLKPVFADIDQTYNLNVQTVSNVLSKRTKVLIVQHTFGIPAKIQALKKLCDEKGIVLIEDCAHSLGAEVEGRKVGSFGDLSIFSFGRSKVISCVNGGMVVCNNSKYRQALNEKLSELKPPRWFYIFQTLLHPSTTMKAKWFYRIQLGKFILVLMQKLGLINLEVTPEEKRGKMPPGFRHLLSNAQAVLALKQMRQLDAMNHKRRMIAAHYITAFDLKMPVDGAIFLRFPLQIIDRDRVLADIKKKGLILGDWYKTPIAPPDVDMSKTDYQKGSCPVAEKICERIINLPTYFSLTNKQVEKVIKLIKKYAQY